MKIVINFNKIHKKEDTLLVEIVTKWISSSIEDKSSKNDSVLKYADSMEVLE